MRQRRVHPFARYAGMRVGAGIVLLLLTSMLIFVSTSVIPGDPAAAILGRAATPETLAALRVQLGLDESQARQYLDWLSGFVRGDLGESFAAQAPVSDVLSDRVVNTLVLAVLAMALIVPVALILGTLAGVKAGGPRDQAISNASLIFISVPEFTIATLLILVFAVQLGWLPAVSFVPPGTQPWSQPSSLVLPVITLALVASPFATRMVRAGVADTMSARYVQMARLNGIAERRVIRQHVLRNALAPSVQVFALTLLWLIGGVIVVETIFAYPGVGQVLVEAVVTRDLPLVQSLTMLIAMVYVTINIVADLLVIAMIPRLRTA